MTRLLNVAGSVEKGVGPSVPKTNRLVQDSEGFVADPKGLLQLITLSTVC